MLVLVINCGSSSIKYQIIDSVSEDVLENGLVENIGAEKTYQGALSEILAVATRYDIQAVGHRVVHGGSTFTDAVQIDDQVIDKIKDCISFAPLHNPANLAGIENAREAFPTLPHIAVFDTAFHSRMPEHAWRYAIDKNLADERGIRRYGFHGTSHAFVAGQAARYLERPVSELRLVSVHLGNGASACAVEFGHSVDTSMGMTPLEGLVMGTRSGDIDPGVIVSLIHSGEFSAAEVDTLLNKNSGLKGLSGLSNDLREIEKEASEGNEQARLAIAIFVHRVRKYIGAYAAAMGGVDAIILTGGIGENSATMRQRILQRFDFLGLKLDENANLDCSLTRANPVGLICKPISRVKAMVIKTNEELMIARSATEIVEANKAPPVSKAIPIAVSGRHLHLNEETFQILFGKEAEPTPYKDLSQPGQYACHEKVNLLGPGNRIDGVRLLGPLRSKNQIEISRTDEFFLGIDAPVRDSGRTENSAPIKIEGPKGTVELPEGLICARRHIHMHPDDADAFGVENRDEVEVAITGGPRDLTFGDVLIRVSPKYRLEMHIDTDEANAAELPQQTDGELVYTGVHAQAKITRARKPLA
ncbi:MAG: acetate kinase [Gammaproteobacteria bacterium]|nr:MAG: acetate kinase [Pseudomonadota bacterium]PIE38336.1 MAG: acetate kinase [Gammaproteobacteria bacterium]